MFQVLFGADCVDVRLGEAGAADRKGVVGGDQFHQFARVLQAALRFAPLLLARGRVAAQREHVVDARDLHLVERGAQFRHGGAHASEVRHRLQPVLLADVLDDLDRFAPGGAAGAVGDGHERRVQAAQLGERRAQILLPRLRLGRKELEGERRPGGGQAVDAHPGIIQPSARARRGCSCRSTRVDHSPGSNLQAPSS